MGAVQVPACSGSVLSQLMDLVVLWNRRIDLTAARSPEELVDLYVADAALLSVCTAPAEAAGTPTRWADVGSGGGAPGLGMAAMRGDLRLTLVEPRAKRVAFLRTALAIVGRTDVELRRARSEQLDDRQWEVACSRATLPPVQWLQEGARLATQAVWVLLARGEPPALGGWRIDLDVRYPWPLTGVSRRAVRFVPETRGGKA